MLTLIISIVLGGISSTLCQLNGVGLGWTIGAGVLTFIAIQAAVSLLLRKKINVVNGDLQGIMLGGQKRINQKIQAFQNKPVGGMKAMQMLLEKEQNQFLQKALDFTVNLEPFCKWNILMSKQIATMRMQFYYQMKKFDKVDKILAVKGLLKGVMLMDPMTVAMKMARLYKNKDMEAVEKLFKKKSKGFSRGGKSVLLYGVYSWILVKNGEVEKARETLYEGKELTSNETLAKNWEVLSNDKVKKFSNAGLGDEWYSLYLETPQQPKQQKVRGN